MASNAFDLTWTEGRTPKEETRNFRIETDGQEREILRIETAPMRNPNGAGKHHHRPPDLGAGLRLGVRPT